MLWAGRAWSTGLIYIVQVHYHSDSLKDVAQSMLHG